MKFIKELIVLFILVFISMLKCSAQDNNELYLDYPEAVGVSYGKNIDMMYLGCNAQIGVTRVRSVPGFNGDLEFGIILGQFTPFICSGFYTCGGEAKREGEGKQGIDYGGGVFAYYQQKKLQIELTNKSAKISFGWFFSW